MAKRPMKNLSIKLQLSLSAIAMVILLLLAQLGLQFYVMRADIVQRIEKHEFRLLTDFATHLDERLQDNISMLANVAIKVPTEILGQTASLERFLQNEHALLTTYDDLYVFDAKGVLLVDWPVKPGRRSLDMSSRDYIQDVIATKEPVISKPFLGKATKQPIVVIAAPILGKNNQLIGIMGGVLNLYKPNLLGSIANRKNGDTGYFYLVTKDRLRIAHPDTTLIFKKVPENSNNIPFENAMNGFEGTQEGYTTRGLKGLFTFKKLTTTDWVVASVVPSAEAFAPIEDLFQKMIWISILLMLVMVPLMWAFVGRLIRPLGLLAKAMHETAAKMRDGRLAAPIGALGGKEIKTVVHAFNEFVEARIRAENDLSKARDAAQAANASKSHFLANMSHEIRTPMNAILGMTELCLQTRMTAEQRSYLDMVATSANSLLAVINDILDFSKIEARKLNLDPHPFSLHSLVRQATRTLSLRASEKELELVCDMACKVPDQVIGDPLRLQQVITNLLGNAIKFTAQGEILLSVKTMTSPPSTDGVWLEFSIKDTGIGIPADKISSLFQPFVQADVSATRNYGGTGLGLAITKRLVQAMNGEAGVESALGVGSTFWITARLHKNLMVKDFVQHDPAENSALTLKREYAGRRVLLAEDDEFNSEIGSILLQNVGLIVDFAENGKVASDKATREHYDLILMDIQMPYMDGLEATRNIRRSESGNSVPIVAMTANAFVEDKQESLSAGMNSFITKPVDPSRLYQVILHEFRRSGI